MFVLWFIRLSPVLFQSNHFNRSPCIAPHDNDTHSQQKNYLTCGPSTYHCHCNANEIAQNNYCQRRVHYSIK